MHAPCASKYVMQQEMVIIIPAESDELQKIIFDLQLIFLSPPADGAGGILATL